MPLTVEYIDFKYRHDSARSDTADRLVPASSASSCSDSNAFRGHIRNLTLTLSYTVQSIRLIFATLILFAA